MEAAIKHKTKGRATNVMPQCKPLAVAASCTCHGYASETTDYLSRIKGQKSELQVHVSLPCACAAVHLVHTQHSPESEVLIAGQKAAINLALQSTLLPDREMYYRNTQPEVKCRKCTLQTKGASLTQCTTAPRKLGMCSSKLFLLDPSRGYSHHVVYTVLCTVHTHRSIRTYVHK